MDFKKISYNKFGRKRNFDLEQLPWVIGKKDTSCLSLLFQLNMNKTSLMEADKLKPEADGLEEAGQVYRKN